MAADDLEKFRVRLSAQISLVTHNVYDEQAQPSSAQGPRSRRPRRFTPGLDTASSSKRLKIQFALITQHSPHQKSKLLHIFLTPNALLSLIIKMPGNNPFI